MIAMPFWSTVLRLACIGIGTVAGSTLAFMLWFVLAEGAAGFATALIYILLAACSVMLMALAPGYVAWFILVWGLGALGQPPHRAAVLAATLIALAGGALVGLAVARFSDPSFGADDALAALALAVTAGLLAAGLTHVLIPAQKGTVAT